MADIINCTQHNIDVLKEGDVHTITPCGTVARVETTNTTLPSIEGFSVTTLTFGNLIGLPEPQPDTYLIVSLLVLNAGKALGRTDLIAPDSGATAVRAVKDGDRTINPLTGDDTTTAVGQIICVRGFVA